MATPKKIPEPQPLHPIKREQIRDILKKEIAYGPQGSKIEEFFERIDADGGGTLECEELIMAVRDVFHILPNEISDAQIHALFKVLDEDDSGNLELSELMAFITAAQFVPERGFRQMIRPQVSNVRTVTKVLREAAEARQNQAEGGDENAAVGYRASDILVRSDGTVEIVDKGQEEVIEEEPTPSRKKIAGAKVGAPTPAKISGKSRAEMLAIARGEPTGKVGGKMGRTMSAAKLAQDNVEKIKEEELERRRAQEKARKDRERREIIERRAILEDKEALSQMLRDVIKTPW